MKNKNIVGLRWKIINFYETIIYDEENELNKLLAWTKHLMSITSKNINIHFEDIENNLKFCKDNKELFDFKNYIEIVEKVREKQKEEDDFYFNQLKIVNWILKKLNTRIK